MRLALECPTKYLGHIQPFADFDWILAHKVLEDKDYAEWYANSKKLKYLDNSVNELGEPVSFEDLEKASKIVGDDCLIVSPDWLGEAKKTVEVWEKCCEKFKISRVVPVVQGADVLEAFEVAAFYTSAYKAQNLPCLLTVPYDLGSKKTDSPEIMGTRRALFVTNLPQEVGVHLLGFSWLDELAFYRGKANVISIDTGVPVLLGFQGLDIMHPLPSKSDPTLNLMEKSDMDAKGWATICRNIALLRKYLY